MTRLDRSSAARATCAEFYGHIAIRRGKRELVDNRCDTCPLRDPCLTCGRAPASTIGELNASIATFNRAAATILGAAA